MCDNDVNIESVFVHTRRVVEAGAGGGHACGMYLVRLQICHASIGTFQLGTQQEITMPLGTQQRCAVVTWCRVDITNQKNLQACNKA